MRVNTVRSIAASAACVLFLVACGEEPPASPDAGTADAGPIEIDASTPDASTPDAGPSDAGPPDTDALLAMLRTQWCAARANLTCDGAYDCLCGRGARPELASCVTDETNRCDTSMVQPLRAHLESGRVRVDLEALARCEAHLRDGLGAACSGRTDDVAEWCGRILIDDVAEHADCASQMMRCLDGDGMCATGTCERAPALGESCEHGCAGELVCRGGTCAAVSDVGGDCERDSHCAGTAFCVAGMCRASRVAVGGACEVTLECVGSARCVGGACVMAEAADTCEGDRDCGALAACMPVDDLVCVALGARGAGEECFFDDMCDDGTYCEAGVCAERVASGSACSSQRMCVVGTHCDLGSDTPTCVNDGELGARCDAIASYPGDGCVASLACVGGECQAVPGESELCADDDECSPGLVCGAGSRCRAPLAIDASCETGTPDNPCVEGAFCDAGTCAPARTAGASCDFVPGECASGLGCVEATVGSYECATLPGVGERCESECAGRSTCAFAPIGGRCEPFVCEAIPTMPRPF